VDSGQASETCDVRHGGAASRPGIRKQQGIFDRPPAAEGIVETVNKEIVKAMNSRSESK